MKEIEKVMHFKKYLSDQDEGYQPSALSQRRKAQPLYKPGWDTQKKPLKLHEIEQKEFEKRQQQAQYLVANSGLTSDLNREQRL